MNKIDEKADNVVTAGKKWVFDEEVAQCFANMLARSIPGYEQMRELTLAIGDKYLREKGVSIVTDIGCSNGLDIQPFIDKYGARIHTFLIDSSQAMIDEARKRFSGWVECDAMKLYCSDVTKQYPPAVADVTLCILALQFTPIEERQQLLKKIYDHTQKGGALILVEKVQGENASMDDMLTACYYAHKRNCGYTDQQIAEKRESLRGVLVNLKPAWNEQLLKEAGFTDVQMFWRHLNFCGWVAVK